MQSCNLVQNAVKLEVTDRFLGTNRLQVTFFPKHGTSAIVKNEVILYILGAKTQQVVE